MVVWSQNPELMMRINSSCCHLWSGRRRACRSNAGPSQIAGELCSPWFFSSSWQGDQVPQAIGEYMNQKNVKTAYLIAPNYAAGKDVISGLKANFRGQVLGEDYTRWPDQLDISPELSKARAAKPDAPSRDFNMCSLDSTSQTLEMEGLEHHHTHGRAGESMEGLVRNN